MLSEGRQFSAAFPGGWGAASWGQEFYTESCSLCLGDRVEINRIFLQEKEFLMY